jgi:FtsP/CotA-like multicopper oxidase with cupredoxin domain
LDKFAARATREVLDAHRDVLGDIPPAAVEWIRQPLATRFDGFANGRGATLIERARMNVAPDGARELVDRAALRAKRDLEITIQPIEVLRTTSATFGHGGLKGHFPHRGPEPNVDHARASYTPARMRLNLAAPVAALVVLTAGAAAAQPVPAPSSSVPLIGANDNRRAAGERSGNALRMRLVVESGRWQPEGSDGRTFLVQAFREEGRELTSPGPLVRVPAGTEIVVSVRNNLHDSVSIFGFVTRPAVGPPTSLDVAPGETRETRFLAGVPGTYHYWATTTGRPLAQRGDIDSQLNGAFVVDPPGAVPEDRILVVSLWRKPGSVPGSVDIGAINGRSWPLTEPLDYRVGDVARWRVVNLSLDPHAMHLHGMFFRVLANGDGLRDHPHPSGDRPFVVTEHMAVGETTEMEWTPERAGNWLFHCHMVSHMAPDTESPRHGQHVHDADASAGMAGLVVGIRVAGATRPAVASAAPPRRFALKLREEAGRYGDRPGFRIDVDGIEATRLSSGPVPGPVLTLVRGEPVEVDLINEMTAATAIHWHGIELDSYFDGVPGWGGTAGSRTPPIAAGQQFTAKFTPPRAGTYIYHTHWHDEAQLSGGLYGALIVLEPGERYDPATDHIFIAAYDGPTVPGRREPIVINGRSASVPALAPGPTPTALRANAPNRVRLINITPASFGLTFVLTDGFAPVQWKPLAKDGADLPQHQRRSREARQLVTVGETYDFEIQPTVDKPLWLELRRGNGEWVAQILLVTRSDR